MPQYNKTVWVNDGPPAIDATNLNKIEQGIFDSLRQDGSTTMSGQLVTTAGSVTTPAIAPTGDSNTGIFFPAADTIAFGEGGAEAMRITSTGNVGVGDFASNPPPVQFSVSSLTGGVVGVTTKRGSGTNASPISMSYGFYGYLDSEKARITATERSGNTNASDLNFQVKDSSDVLQSRLYISTAGNVGIGTTSPTVKLDVTAGTTANTVTSFFTQGNADGNFKLGFANGSGSTANSEQGALVFNYTTTRIGSIGFHRGSAANCDAITFSTSLDNERMRINASGNVGIGTSTPDVFGRGYSGTTVGISSTGQSALQLNSATGNAAYLDLGVNGSRLGYVQAQSTDLQLISVGSIPLYLGTNNIVRATITSTGNVGIGTTSPSKQLHVKSGTAEILRLETTVARGSGSNYIQFNDATGSKGFVGYGNTNDVFYLSNDLNESLTLRTNATERVFITGAGNVGIGTTSPTAYTGYTTLELDGATNGGILSIKKAGSIVGYLNGSSGLLLISQTGNLVMKTSGADALVFGTNATDRMWLTSSGNVGIGTQSPSAKMQIDGSDNSFNPIQIINNTNTGINAYSYTEWQSNNGTNKLRIGIYSTNDGKDAFISNAAGSNIRFESGTGAGAEKMRITSTGNVGIGTTSPSYNLEVSRGSDPSIGTYTPISGSAGVGALFFDGNDSAGTRRNYALIQGAITSGTAGSYSGLINFFTANNGTIGQKMILTGAGYLLVGYTTSNGAYPLQVNGQIFATSSTIATSDGRYKKDVVALDGALDIVKALNPVQFSWKEHPVHKFNTDVPTVGFIAQEVEQALADKSYLTSIIKKSECTWETETGETIEREVTRNVEKQVTREVEREVTETIDGEEVTRTITEEVTETVIEQVTEIVTEPVKETHTEEFLGIAESNLIAILTKAVKELTAKVEALEAQLNK